MGEMQAEIQRKDEVMKQQRQALEKEKNEKRLKADEKIKSLKVQGEDSKRNLPMKNEEMLKGNTNADAMWEEQKNKFISSSDKNWKKEQAAVHERRNDMQKEISQLL